MDCPTCSNKGYQESTIAKDNNFSPMITRCPNPTCPYSQRYYDEVKRRFHDAPETHEPYINPNNIGIDLPQTQVPKAAEVPAQGLDQETMSKKYPHLPAALVDFAKEMMSEEPDAGIVLQTPFGPLATRNLSVANRIMGIIKSYLDNAEALQVAQECDNCLIFPIERALGFNE